MRQGIKTPLVEVTWIDACSYHGWYTDAELAEVTCLDKMRTIGFLVRKNATEVAVAQTLGGNGKWSEVWVIPAKNVMKVRQL